MLSNKTDSAERTRRRPQTKEMRRRRKRNKPDMNKRTKEWMGVRESMAGCDAAQRFISFGFIRFIHVFILFILFCHHSDKETSSSAPPDCVGVKNPF